AATPSFIVAPPFEAQVHGMSDVDTLRSAGQIVAWIRSHVSEAAHLRIDSREVGRGDVFLALPGRRDDGRLHVADAVARGAAAVGLQRQARALLDAGAQALAMEVSSIGLDQRRTDSTRFDLALFTNLTRDHLDYHGSMAEYEHAKEQLFDAPSLAQVVLNMDD